jgi:hypothetical protein
MSSVTVYVKSLRLVLPEIAEASGLALDAPAFVSPIIQWERVCSLCGRIFGPLVYQVGHVTTAHHFHPDGSGDSVGGIYCFALSPASPIAPLAIPTGFVAAVEPLGEMTRRTLCGRHCCLPEAVRTREIMAYCLHTALSRRATQHHGLIPLEEGILLARPATPPPGRRLRYDTHPGDLLPLCGPHELYPGEQAPFTFHSCEGEIGISLR